MAGKASGASKGLANASAIMGIISAGAGLLSGALEVSANRKQARATLAALQAEKRYNIGLLKQQKKDKYWADLMSAWASGTTAGIGTSTYGATMSNQSVLESEIQFQEQQYNTQIAAAEQASKQRFLGIF